MIQEIQRIDIIADILKIPEARDTYLGEEVNIFLMDRLGKLSKPTLMEINLQKANPIDYLFTKSAFGPFYKAITQCQDHDCLFLVNKSQCRNLFWGLLASIDGNLNRASDYEKDFSENCEIKIRSKDSDISFIGVLDQLDTEILRFINSAKLVEESFVYSEFGTHTSHEKIGDAIKRLKLKKFIYSDDVAVPIKIYSVQEKINQYGSAN